MIAKAPLRVSFAGGGTDISPYAEQYGGCVLSMAIKKFTYAKYPARSETLLEKTISNFFAVEGISITSEALPMSGLGGSASCFVAGIKAIKPNLKRRRVAELAYHLERDVMGVAGGKQDQYMVSFGGLNYLEFTDKVRIKQLKCPEGLEDLLILVYLGRRKNAGQDIIKDQMGKLNYKAFQQQKDIAREMVNCLEDDRVKDFGRFLDKAWHSKMEFSPLVATDEIKDFYYNCIKWGAIGGKLTGAGGGGYMLLMEHPDKIGQLRLKLWAARIDFEKVQYEGRGVRCVKSR